MLRDEEMIVGDLDMSDPSEEQQAGDADIQDVAAILIDLQVIFAMSRIGGTNPCHLTSSGLSHVHRAFCLHLQGLQCCSWADLWLAFHACLPGHKAADEQTQHMLLQGQQ